jgi:O-antigen/teichoic acid export membrane protein
VAITAALPAYTRLREQGAAALAGRLRLTLSAVTFLLCAAFVPALLLRRELVLLVGGHRWVEAASLVPPVLLLCLLRSANIQLGTLLLALERADLDARVKLGEALLFVPGCALAVAWYGSAGAAWAGALSYGLALAARSQVTLALLPGEGAAVRAAWARPALSGLLCGLSGLWMERAGAAPLLVAPLALAVFLLLALRLDPALWREVRGLRRPDEPS